MSAAAERRAAYEHIIASGEAALARWRPSNPMCGTIKRQIADAVAQLARLPS